MMGFVQNIFITVQMFSLIRLDIVWIGKHYKVQSVFYYIQKKLDTSIFHLLTVRHIFFLFLSISSHLKHISVSTCKSPKKVHTVFILKVENSLESDQIGIYTVSFNNT